MAIPAAPPAPSSLVARSATPPVASVLEPGPDEAPGTEPVRNVDGEPDVMAAGDGGGLWLGTDGSEEPPKEATGA